MILPCFLLRVKCVHEICTFLCTFAVILPHPHCLHGMFHPSNTEISNYQSSSVQYNKKRVHIQQCRNFVAPLCEVRVLLRVCVCMRVLTYTHSLNLLFLLYLPAFFGSNHGKCYCKNLVGDSSDYLGEV